MSLTCGIVGLPNVGKSTIFNALASVKAQVANYPFTTIDPNVGIMEVPDGRLDKLAYLISPEKITPTTVEFMDIAGLVKGASHGEGLGNQFLSHIRNVDAMVHVVRCYEDSRVAHIYGDLNPLRDLEVIETELIIADLEVIERRLEKVKKLIKGGDEDAKEREWVYIKLREGLEKEAPIRLLSLNEKERLMFKDLNLLTSKPVLYVANVGEEDIDGSSERVGSLKTKVSNEGASCITLCGKIEAEVLELEREERKDFLREMGIETSGLERLVKEVYRLLDLITFFTMVGKRELKAWTLPRGAKAIKAAGCIHSDFERGFIKVEVIAYEDFLSAGSGLNAREKGMARIEGRDYIVKDGDILHFRV